MNLFKEKQYRQIVTLDIPTKRVACFKKKAHQKKACNGTFTLVLYQSNLHKHI